MAQTPAGLFITGTDTGVGKTYVGALVARALVGGGHRVGVYKPAASGCRREGGMLVSDDAVALWEAAGRPGDLARVCPQCFEAPLAPHLAARAEGKRLDPELLRSGLDYWRSRCEVLLVEGAGGLMSPMGEEEYVADLVYDFGLPLVIVSRNVLGTINQTLQTLITAAAFREGLARVARFPGKDEGDRHHLCETPFGPLRGKWSQSPPEILATHGLAVAGVVLNHPAPPSADDASLASNRQELVARCGPPVLAEVVWGAEGFDVEVDWAAIAGSASA